VSTTTLDDATRAVIAAWERLAEPAGLLEWLEQRPRGRRRYVAYPLHVTEREFHRYLNDGREADVRLTLYLGRIYIELAEFSPALIVQLPASQWVSRLVQRLLKSEGHDAEMKGSSLAALIRETLAEETAAAGLPPARRTTQAMLDAIDSVRTLQDGMQSASGEDTPRLIRQARGGE